MNEFIMISLNCNPFVSQELDLRVPTHLTLKELLQIVSEAYNLGFELINPSA
ncbi:type VII secretion protein, partial [Streptococcus suis]|nr:type VII secretion protein [Streptococcus suis]